MLIISEAAMQRKSVDIYEGTARMAIFSRGKYKDILMLSITRPEFKESQSTKWIGMLL
ncbi:MAG TPA: hypothetical protein VEG39_15620 [Clostridia bacterium]|nr:hypothetical protein [Clostridia bacterium]